MVWNVTPTSFTRTNGFQTARQSQITHLPGQDCLNTDAAQLIVIGLHHLPREISDTEFLTRQVVPHAIFITK